MSWISGINTRLSLRSVIEFESGAFPNTVTLIAKGLLYIVIMEHYTAVWHLETD